MGAVPGGDAQYASVIQELHALETGEQARAPSQFFGALLVGLNAPFVNNVPNPTGSEWQTSDPEEIRRFQSDPLCGKPFSNSMTYSVLKGFHSLWLPENESRIPVDLPILLMAGTDDPVGAKTATIQDLITRYMRRGQLALEYFNRSSASPRNSVQPEDRWRKQRGAMVQFEFWPGTPGLVNGETYLLEPA